MKLPSLSLLADAFVGALRRFPLTMLSAAIACGALMWLVEDGNDNQAGQPCWGFLCLLRLPPSEKHSD
jgi:hypothetical protein